MVMNGVRTVIALAVAAAALGTTETPASASLAGAFPDVQLLVVSSRHRSVDYLKQQIAKRHFREVYGILQEGADAERLFFYDMGCDGR